MGIWMLAFSDLHMGSAFSMWPPDLKLSSGMTPNLPKHMLYVWKNWLDIKDAVWEYTDGNGPDIVVEVGDSIQGTNKKQDGEFVIETKTARQGLAAMEAIKVMKPERATFLKFRGTRYHVGNQAETEEWIAHELGAEPTEMGNFCWDWLPNFDIAGVILDIAHHQSAVQVNRTMPLEREIRYSNNVDPRLKKKPHLILRAHGHIGAIVDVDGEVSVGLPPLKMQDDFAKGSKVPNRLLTKFLGVMLIHIIPENLETLDLPFMLYPLRFLHPPLPTVVYEERRCEQEDRSRLYHG